MRGTSAAPKKASKITLSTNFSCTDFFIGLPSWAEQNKFRCALSVTRALATKQAVKNVCVMFEVGLVSWRPVRRTFESSYERIPCPGGQDRA